MNIFSSFEAIFPLGTKIDLFHNSQFISQITKYNFSFVNGSKDISIDPTEFENEYFHKIIFA